MEEELENLKNNRKKVLITGGTGFVGSHIVSGFLKETNWDIKILDRLSYAGNLNRITEIDNWKLEKDRVKFVYHDLRSPISSIIDKLIGEVDYIIHLAAESDVQRSLKNALPFAQSNVVGTTNLLEWIKNSRPNIKKYIGFNTDEVYGPAEKGEYHPETDKFYPSNPYSAAKAGQWSMEYAFAHSFKIPICMVHSMNIFGERQHPEKFVPMVVRKILRKEKVIIHGKPNQISQRHWLFTKNIYDGLFFLLFNGKREESYNIVGEEKDALWMANKISQIIQGRKLKENEIEFKDYHVLRPGHDFRYALSGEKLKKLGWIPKLNLEESLRKCVEWMIRPENQKWLDL